MNHSITFKINESKTKKVKFSIRKIKTVKSTKHLYALSL